VIYLDPQCENSQLRNLVMLCFWRAHVNGSVNRLELFEFKTGFETTACNRDCIFSFGRCIACRSSSFFGGGSSVMIICSCNVLTDHDVRTVVSAASASLRTAGDVYGCLGCTPKCGRCALTIRRIMDAGLVCPEDCTGCAAMRRYRG
jgi:bacterioferritin-associated ferredoxin